jgi:4-amino-4-deoxy-L-arabinose transferase-like glycosyltransferase
MPLNYRKPFLAIIIFGVLVRVAAAFYMGNQVVELPGTADQLSYHALALRVLGGHGFSFGEPWWPHTAAGAPTAQWSYLYTFYLTGVYALFGPNPLVARIFQAVMVGLLQPYLAFRLASYSFKDERIGVAAAALMACYLYFVYYAAALMTEPFFITGVLAALALTIRLARSEGREAYRLGIVLGIVIGATILLRQLFLLMVPVLVGWLWWVHFRQRAKVPLGATVLVGSVVLAMILPFTVYNYARFDQFLLLNSNTGYAFFWANHPVYGTQFEPILPPEMGTYESLIPEALRRLDEVALERALMARGIGFVLDDPARYARLSLSRVPAYFMFWPSPTSSVTSNVVRVASFGLLWPFMLYGLWVASSRRPLATFVQQPVFLLILFAVIYTAIHLLSWTLIRYRLPVDAVLLVFAALGVVTVLDNAFSKIPTGRRVFSGNPTL